MSENLIKDKQILAYYHETKASGKATTKTRHWIHPKGRWLWASVRDLSQTEIIANQTIGVKVSLIFIVNWNPKILHFWDKPETPFFIIFKGRTFKISSKPDEYNYTKGDMRIEAQVTQDNTNFAGEVWDE